MSGFPTRVGCDLQGVQVGENKMGAPTLNLPLFGQNIVRPRRSALQQSKHCTQNMEVMTLATLDVDHAGVVSPNSVVPQAGATSAPSPSAEALIPQAVQCSPDLRTVAWTDFDVDTDGNAVGIYGIVWGDLKANQLRTMASRLDVKGIKNAKKSCIIEKLCVTHLNKKVYADYKLRDKDKPNRKEVQCPFRLMNLLFSDEFAGAFATLGDVASRQLLDTGKAGNDEHFWVNVRRSFVVPHPVYDLLAFWDDDVFLAADHIDPGKIVKHDWKKLRAIWKGVNAEYKAALTRFSMSGTHESRFFDFCNGRLETYYLRKHLDEKPQLNDTVEADLPEETAVSSDTSSTVGVSTSASAPKKKKSGNDVADAIREYYGDSQMRTDLTKQKISFMSNEEVRRQKEEARRDNEESRRDKVEARLQKEDSRRDEEHLQRMAEHQQNSHKNMFDEWERIQKNLKAVRDDLKNPEVDDDVKLDLRSDMAGFLKRKRTLAVALGINTE